MIPHLYFLKQNTSPIVKAKRQFSQVPFVFPLPFCPFGRKGFDLSETQERFRTFVLVTIALLPLRKVALLL